MYLLLAITFFKSNLIALFRVKNWSIILKDSCLEDDDLKVLDKTV